MDQRRCRYADCIEGHYVLPEDSDEQVTCPTCRLSLGLPRLVFCLSVDCCPDDPAGRAIPGHVLS